MKEKMTVQKFIEQHADWEKLLSEKPYCLHITKDNFNGKNLVMFKYDQFKSDMSLPIVQECRGLILDFDTNEIVSFPFKKFFNMGEINAADIDWKSCYVTEKLDGSLVKIVRLGDDLLISTNGNIDAFKAPVAKQVGCTAKTFGNLVYQALLKQFDNDGRIKPDWLIDPLDELKSMLNENMTYMFELTSPFNRVVVRWDETQLHFIGCRDNITGKETFFGDHPLVKVFHTPKVFPLHTVAECVAAAEKLGDNAEGYVVVDKDFNRVKVKSPTYVKLHHLHGNGVLSYARGLEVVRKNEIDEVVAYFPDFKSQLMQIKADYDAYALRLHALRSELDEWIASNMPVGTDNLTLKESRANAAKFILSKHKALSGFAFSCLDNKVESINDWLSKMTTQQLMVALGYKEKIR